MKKNIKIACVVAISIALFSCATSSDEMPVMDKNVVSYKMIFRRGEPLAPKYSTYQEKAFALDRDTLESWFPHIFSDEQVESKCNYFAILFNTYTNVMEYWILSQDMVLYRIKPGRGKDCTVHAETAYHTMLVCDDTEEGNLKDKINLNSILSYTDEDWNCNEGKDVFF